MNMNNFPRGFEHATERNPPPRWLRWLAAEIQELRDAVVGVIAILTIFIGLAMLPAIIG